MNDPNLAQRLSEFCGEVKGGEREACFRGIGYSHAPVANFDPLVGSKFCDKMGPPGGGRLWCREGLAWALYADPAFRPKAEEACTTGLANDEAKQCKQDYLFSIQ